MPKRIHAPKQKITKVRPERVFIDKDVRRQQVASLAYQPGDFILTHRSDWLARLIYWGQSFRFRGDDARYARYGHVALIASDSGDIIEALGNGIVSSHISKYDTKEFVLVNIEASDEDRSQAVAFAHSCIGDKYGFLTFFSIGISLITGLSLSFGFEGQHVCSGLVARALERTQAIFDRNAEHIAPGDLAKWYEVT